MIYKYNDEHRCKFGPITFVQVVQRNPKELRGEDYLSYVTRNGHPLFALPGGGSGDVQDCARFAALAACRIAIKRQKIVTRL